ncbi:MAG: 6-phosphogluconolactonase [Candidatus Heimdallarchaeota archaeon LC_2]|nr:MAG: 6-phosphogluconolactonase [Candidatus Heimdallarchaeota archaeon LC_2]
MKIEKFSDLHEISAVLASNLTSDLINKVRNSEYFSIALSGGSTPNELYRLINSKLMQSKIDFSDYLGICQIDERWVSSDHDRSNQLMIKNTMPFTSYLDHYIPIPITDSFSEINEAVKQYEVLIKGLIDKFNFIDIGIFGMGSDGHTASLFPNENILKSLEGRFVVSGFIGSQDEFRISITPTFMKLIKRKILLITGSIKGQVLRNAVTSNNYELYPVLFAIDQTTSIFMDEAAYNEYKK